MTLFVHKITDIDPVEAFKSVSHIPYSLLLDSADPKHKLNRYSYVMTNPVETIETNFDELQTRLSEGEKTKHIEGLPPFQGGAAGLFSYDLARTLEDLPDTAQKNTSTPDMAIGIYDQVLAHDHHKNKSYIFTHAANKQEAQKKRKTFLQLITQKTKEQAYQPSPLKWSSNFDEKSYCEAVQKIIDYIYAGDIFQANISQRFTAAKPEGFDPYQHYCHMRKCNPAPFACYMNLGNTIISSSSPERFITIDQKSNIQTCPIKGTRPRSNDPKQDNLNKKELIKSEKDRAENTMIVDLLRNDLSKVCVPDSMDVTKLCALESFTSVHHLVSTITAKLAPNKSAIDTLKASFPGGSITGAPKIRAMEIIEELEDKRRGAYCGSIGYVGFNGTMDTNILIRTVIYDKNTITLQVGGGIVSDSSPEAEYQETLDKAKAIIDSF